MKSLQLNPSEADISGPTTVDSTAPKGLVFHYADEAKPLATPWQVAIERAKLVRKCKLPQGPILDPACGSGIQLAAYCAMLGRSGVGIEMDEATAIAANANLRRVADQGFGESLLSSSLESSSSDFFSNHSFNLSSVLLADESSLSNSDSSTLVPLGSCL